MPDKINIDENNHILNCVPSLNTQDDWSVEKAKSEGLLDTESEIPSSVDLREDWWEVKNQGKTGACVGYSTAYGVLKWHYVRKGIISESDLPSARFIWMANKETDEITSYPSTFLETQGTQVKLSLRIARNYGCVLEEILPMDGRLSMMEWQDFYALAAKLKIKSYHNLGRNLDDWKRWLAFNGPILTRLDTDKSWDYATESKGRLEYYIPKEKTGGHAVCITGYDKNYFTVMNSWGKEWGDSGFAYSSYEYTKEAFTEAYGVVL